MALIVRSAGALRGASMAGSPSRMPSAGTTAERLSPHALPGGYPSLLTADEPERVAQAYGPNAARLTAAKEAYDPGNVFTAAPLPGATSA